MKLAKIKTSCFFTLNNNIFITTSILECFSYFSLRFYLSVYYFCVLNSQNTTFCKQKPKYVTPTFYIKSEKYQVPCIMSVFELHYLSDHFFVKSIFKRLRSCTTKSLSFLVLINLFIHVRGIMKNGR